MRRTKKYPSVRVFIFDWRSRTALLEPHEIGSSPGSGVVEVLCARRILARDPSIYPHLLEVPVRYLQATHHTVVHLARTNLVSNHVGSVPAR